MKKENLARVGRALGRAGIVLAITFVLLLFYLFAAHQCWTAVFWIYFFALAAAAVGYVCWNRGFTRAKITPEDLPRDWPEERRAAYFAERERWRRQSRFLLYLIISLLLTFLFDTLSLYAEELTAFATQAFTPFFGK